MSVGTSSKKKSEELKRRLAAAKELILRQEGELAALGRRVAALEVLMEERAAFVLSVTSDARKLVETGSPDEVVRKHLQAAHDYVLKTWVETPAAHGKERSMVRTYDPAYVAEHPEYFVRIDGTKRNDKPDPKGKRWTNGQQTFEVRRWGTYPSGKQRWTTFCVETGKPDTRRQLVRPSFSEAERALERFAEKAVYVEAKR